MKMLNNKINQYDNNDVLDIIRNLPTMEEIEIKLPHDLDKKIENEVIETLKVLAPDYRGKYNFKRKEGEGLKIKGYKNIMLLLYQLRQNIAIYYGFDNSEGPYVSLADHIVHELLKVGFPFEAQVYVPEKNKVYDGKIIIEGQERDTFVYCPNFIIGPYIPLHERLRDFYEPGINILIEHDGAICGPMTAGEMYLDYIKDQRIRIDEVIIEELGIVNGDVIQVRIFLFPYNEEQFQIKYVKADKVKILKPKGIYLCGVEKQKN